MTFAEIAMLLNCASFRWRVIVMRRCIKSREKKELTKSQGDGGNIVKKRGVERHQKKNEKGRLASQSPAYAVARFTICRRTVVNKTAIRLETGRRHYLASPLDCRLGFLIVTLPQD